MSRAQEKAGLRTRSRSGGESGGCRSSRASRRSFSLERLFGTSRPYEPVYPTPLLLIPATRSPRLLANALNGTPVRHRERSGASRCWGLAVFVHVPESEFGILTPNS
ncbi:unnamed protein product [Pleuronectes platessa]|uniref:Uncharacterized protein n=1 Tax=Pleuronectes platessa TaxID=8262 RepID=A0A9N7Z724_PLEPL|nr:unnamed protein product [Pleuronectes platessa]